MEKPVLFIIPGACSFGSMVALEWSKAPYQIGITTPEIRASEAFKKVNPSGKVGALKDGETVVGENLAILLYLADKFGDNKMCPAIGTSGREKVYQWLSYLSSTLHPAFAQALFAERFAGEEHAESFKKLAIERLHIILEYIDKSFLQSGFLITDRATIVDSQAYGLLRWGKGFKGGEPIVDINKYPKIIKFYELMENEQAVKNALAIEKEHAENLEGSNFAGYFQFS